MNRNKLSFINFRYWDKECMKMKRGKEPSLLLAVLACFKWHFIFAATGFTALYYLQLAPPLLTGYLLDYFDSPPNISEKSAWLYGLGLAIVSLSSWLPGVIIAHAVAICPTCLRASFSALIFKKTLLLSSTGRSKTSTGQIMTFLSTDLEKFYWFFLYSSYVIISPGLAAVIGYMLYREFDYYGLAAIGILVFLVPIQHFVARLYGKLRVNIADGTDARLNMMEQVLSGMRVIKMYCWEKPFEKILTRLRDNEVNYIRKSYFIRGLNWVGYFAIGKLSLLAIIIPYVLTGNTLKPKTIYVTIAWIEVLRPVVFWFLPTSIETVTEIKESLRRIQVFLLLEEKCADDAPVEVWEDEDTVIKLLNLVTVWPTKEQESGFKMKKLDFTAKRGELISVVGQVGSGKSSFLYTLLNEMRIESGSRKINGVLSYASQEAWIFSGSVRDNILYNQPYEETRYKAVIRACCLEDDIKGFQNGDRNFVGENGSALSGGQKARINLARAVYKEADVYLLDDPLSAVDTKVCKRIFNDCIEEFLGDKTRILVTHQVQFLKKVDRILVLQDGKTIMDGPYEEFLNKQTQYFPVLSMIQNNEDNQSLDDVSLHSFTTHRVRTRTMSFGEEETRQRVLSVTSIDAVSPTGVQIGTVMEEYEGLEDNEGSSFETKSSAKQTFISLLDYIKAGKGGIFLPFLLVISVSAQVLYIFIDVLLTKWAEDMFETERKGDNHSNFLDKDTYLPLSSGLTGAMIVGGIARCLLFYSMTACASRVLHATMLKSVLRSPTQFFNTNPVGRILNRFSRDLGFIDEYLPYISFDVLYFSIHYLGVLVYTVISNPWMGLMVAPVLFIVFIVRYFAVPAIREMKKLEALARNPVYTQFDSMLKGINTIRALKSEKFHEKTFMTQQDAHSAAWFHYVMCDRWFTNKLEIIVGSYITGLVFVSIATSTSLDQTSFGLSIIYTLGMLSIFQYIVRRTVELESTLTSVQRVSQYGSLPMEARFESDNTPGPAWPENGSIKFDCVSLSYDQNEVYQLCNVSFDVKGGDKVGIVGRSGAGKSTIMTAILRLAEPEGKVIIDGIDVSQIGLHELRMVISIIPQDPILFTGTLRENMDPFSEFSDEEIWNVLRNVQMKNKIFGIVGQLLSPVEASGSNFSAGERQLLCLARAMLRKNKILIIDEATANVDSNTDSLIQEVVRERFENCTVLTIAHRLETIIDSDRVFVVDAGRIAENDHPYNLLQNEAGLFYKLVEQGGKKKADSLRQSAYNSYLGHSPQYVKSGGLSAVPEISHIDLIEDDEESTVHL
ncbi:DgyrCDS12027 [Dimorphilus gyrociliatus]|uniref:DgyrCDS12027 n=1 Tax=Dimorphilus gyrociliatus TaxID=2664684 RepID=A0A7I8W581_9ANNE|nr:DgyrCDS12027 [Dimorphilus gyrociliatus]